MPEPALYKRGFDLNKGTEFAGYKLSNISIQHVTEQRYKYYTYPTELIFTPTSNAQSETALMDAIHKHVSGSRTINSSHGNPYRCSFEGVTALRGHKQDDGSVLVTAEGSCERV